EYTEPGASLFRGATQYVYLGTSSGSFVKTDIGIGVKTVHGPALGDKTSDGFALALNTPWQDFQASPNWTNLVSADLAGNVSANKILWTDPLFGAVSGTNGAFPYLTTIDVNHDGSRDIVMLGRYTGNNNEIWLNDGRGNLTKTKTLVNWVTTSSYQAEN